MVCIVVLLLKYCISVLLISSCRRWRAVTGGVFSQRSLTSWKCTVLRRKEMWRICRVRDMRTGGWEFLQSWFRSSKCHLKCLKVCCSQVCSCCAMRSLYFTWHNVCSVCRRSDHSFLWFRAWLNSRDILCCLCRVVCPGCCLEVGWSLLYWIFRCR